MEEFKKHLYSYLDKTTIDKLVDSFSLPSKHAALLNTNKMDDESFKKLFPNVTPHPIVPHAYIYDKNEYDCEAYRTVLDKTEAEIEYKVQERKHDREPGIFVHHGDSEKIADHVRRFERGTCDEHQDPVKNDVDIEGNDNSFYDPVPDKSLQEFL